MRVRTEVMSWEWKTLRIPLLQTCADPADVEKGLILVEHVYYDLLLQIHPPGLNWGFGGHCG